MAEAETKTCTFLLDPRGFVHAVMREGCEMGIEDARQNVAAIYEIGARRRNPVLVDMRGVRSQSREARQYFAGPEAGQATLAVALLVSSPVSRVLANVFLRLMPQRWPTTLFNNEQAAIEWLLEQKA